jgi:hypothetical protein
MPLDGAVAQVGEEHAGEGGDATRHDRADGDEGKPFEDLLLAEELPVEQGVQARGDGIRGKAQAADQGCDDENLPGPQGYDAEESNRSEE